MRFDVGKTYVLAQKYDVKTVNGNPTLPVLLFSEKFSSTKIPKVQILFFLNLL